MNGCMYLMNSDNAYLATIICNHVRNGERPVLLATRTDELICFLCGMDDHADSADAFSIVGAGHLLERDSTISEVLDLSLGEEAERANIKSRWVRGPVVEES